MQCLNDDYILYIFFSHSKVDLVVCLRLLSFSLNQVCLSFRAKLMSGHFSGKEQSHHKGPKGLG